MTAESGESATLDTFQTLWQQWRDERDAEFRQPHGILAITSINFLTREPVLIDGIPGRWSTSDAGPVVELGEGEELLDEGEVVRGRYAFGPIERPRQLRHGDVVIEVFRNAGWDIVRPKDPEHPLRTGYHGTPTYEPDPSWSIRGRWRPYAMPKSVRIDSVQPKLGGPVDAPGEVEFEVEGRSYRLIATPAHGAPGHVVLLWRDRTSGVTTYPAQRELLVRLPEAGDEVELDFNRAHNKNCAYTDFAICPLPPAGNVLDVAIEAGEQIPYERRSAVDVP